MAISGVDMEKRVAQQGRRVFFVDNIRIKLTETTDACDVYIKTDFGTGCANRVAFAIFYMY